jgi:hypothetical protein
MPENEAYVKRARKHNEDDWCALCGRGPMPVVVDLPDGCIAHPGCANDDVFRDEVECHAR